MSNQLQSTAIIRQRGQLTIPERIRSAREWVDKDSVVTISSFHPDEIVIKPHTLKSREYDWDKMWEAIKKSRAIKGKNKTSSSEFIAGDRLSH